MKIKPYGSLVMVKIMPSEDTKTKAGLVMPDTIVVPTPLVCEIIAVGAESPKNLNSGDKILIPRDASAMPLENVLPTAEDGGVYKLIFPNAIIAALTE